MLLLLVLPRVYAQERSGPAVRRAGTTVNLFEAVDPGQPIDGFQLRFPAGFVVEDVYCFRYGTEPVAADVRSEAEADRVLFLTDRAITGPHELVVRARVPEQEGVFSWELHPLVWRKAVQDSVQGKRYRLLDAVRNQIDVEVPSEPTRRNWALDFSEAAGPVLLPPDRFPHMGEASSFTVAFWMQTNGLGEIVLSTWNGKETIPYPAEFVVDPSGRVRFYSGQPSQHQALRSGWPVADGQWHHVAAVYDAPRSKLRLMVDGRVSDSLRSRLPAARSTGSLAVGGRVPSDNSDQEDDRSVFSGRIDELRIMPKRATVPEVRRMKSRSYGAETDKDVTGSRLRLGFDSDATDPGQAWPEGVRTVPVSRSFTAQLRELQAETDEETVTLRWATEAKNVEAFVVERSENGDTFTPIAELNPAEARQTSALDVPVFTYTDSGVPGRVMYYRIRLRQQDGSASTSGSIKIGRGAETEARPAVELLGNFPNPFSEKTVVAYTVHEANPITITVWDLEGRQRREIVVGMTDPGYHETSLTASNLPSGTYFLRLETPDEQQSRRIVVLQ